LAFTEQSRPDRDSSEALRSIPKVASGASPYEGVLLKAGSARHDEGAAPMTQQLAVVMVSMAMVACSAAPPKPDDTVTPTVDAGALIPDAGPSDAGPVELTLPVDAKWQKLPTVASGGKQDDIHFVDAEHGWYANGDGFVYRTVNGGQAWEQVLSKAGTFWRALGFIDENKGLLGNIGTDYYPDVTDTTPLYWTENGGQTLTPVVSTGPLVKGICAVDVLHTEFINSGVLQKRVVLHAAGRVGGPAFVMRSIDGGRTWITKDLSSVLAMITDVKFLSESVGFVVGGSNANVAESRAVIAKTRDGGETWTKVYQSTRPYELIWKLSLPSSESGFATVQSYNDRRADQVFVKTTNGGDSWTELPLVLDAQARQFGIGFITPSIGWIGTRSGRFQTIDGGDTWRAVLMGAAVNKVRLMNTGNGFVGYAIGFDVYKLDARR